jgi:hypothetical protein
MRAFFVLSALDLRDRNTLFEYSSQMGRSDAVLESSYFCVLFISGGIVACLYFALTS